MKITIYHNPDCSKSRKTLKIILDKGITPEIILYLETPPDTNKIKHICKLLNIKLTAIIRKHEYDYLKISEIDKTKESFLEKWIQKHPIILQRPIIINEENNTAVIGRPPENVLEILPK